MLFIRRSDDKYELIKSSRISLLFYINHSNETKGSLGWRSRLSRQCYYFFDVVWCFPYKKGITNVYSLAVRTCCVWNVRKLISIEFSGPKKIIGITYFPRGNGRSSKNINSPRSCQIGLENSGKIYQEEKRWNGKVHRLPIYSLWSWCIETGTGYRFKRPQTFVQSLM